MRLFDEDGVLIPTEVEAVRHRAEVAEAELSRLQAELSRLRPE